ncbi:GerW family sporulation protein [Fulvivirga sedimenti]|uniref:GerW family sporulation protein n=1 Tax=Fulvivirga sedimenti TaxID=2879465 RepID=A0A9X1HQY3_9BACT|nr:GerW family sporulation protein [Fulvivirga sedimenti]MCA6075531.1 GerW family sporulation protein [Fulvivirga sedimenti]MCA6076708.1 GerW family sporulation protein [Fulvivirga sedimenti]MCA6077836.1 GerW family sporulation protein [Fulvivirga sedimenti]
MEMQFTELLDKITKFIESEARSETVIGKPFKLGEFDCVPVIRIGIGFGSGGGGGNAPKNGQGEGGGAGAGMGIEPIGFLVTKNDEISFLGVNKSSKGISAAFEKIPDLVEKMMTKKKEEA